MTKVPKISLGLFTGIASISDCHIVHNRDVFVPSTLMSLYNKGGASKVFRRGGRSVVFSKHRPCHFSVCRRLFLIVICHGASNYMSIFQYYQYDKTGLYMPTRLKFCPNSRLREVREFNSVIVYASIGTRSFIHIFEFYKRSSSKREVTFPSLSYYPSSIRAKRRRVSGRRVCDFTIRSVRYFLSIVNFRGIVTFLHGVSFSDFRSVFIIVTGGCIDRFFMPP